MGGLVVRILACGAKGPEFESQVGKPNFSKLNLRTLKLEASIQCSTRNPYIIPWNTLWHTYSIPRNTIWHTYRIHSNSIFHPYCIPQNTVWNPYRIPWNTVWRYVYVDIWLTVQVQINLRIPNQFESLFLLVKKWPAVMNLDQNVNLVKSTHYDGGSHVEWE